ncbi:heavy metal-associated isoprenylated plant protein 47-like [Euphorbia lathyris]|uniref:heavy metal-associated isoprenylated plant protein 47-like n=1 Tax=Euphorbia lathyris TaxID=212925 RepID=UPI003313E261
MKQKIVIKFMGCCEKCRRKALQTASVADGVMSVALEGEEKDKLVIIGERVDAACLTKKLRKKLESYVELVTVEEVKPPPPKKPEPKPDPVPVPVPCCQGPPRCEFVGLAYDPPNSSPCAIM